MAAQSVLSPVPVAGEGRFRSIPRSGPRAGKHRLSALTQILDLRDVAYQDGTNPKTRPHIKAALMRAFVDLQELALTMRGIGRPKPVEAKNAMPKHNRRPAVSPVRVAPVSDPSTSSPGSTAP